MSRTDLAKRALEKSLEIREEYGYDFRSPLCVYELADRARVTVRFVDDVSMEGVYASLAKPKILISSLRPAGRRAFTCAHELGHHFFGHGSTIDELKEDARVRRISAERVSRRHVRRISVDARTSRDAGVLVPAA